MEDVLISRSKLKIGLIGYLRHLRQTNPRDFVYDDHLIKLKFDKNSHKKSLITFSLSHLTQ